VGAVAKENILNLGTVDVDKKIVLSNAEVDKTFLLPPCFD
jgi:hypothetical protein